MDRHGSLLPLLFLTDSWLKLEIFIVNQEWDACLIGAVQNCECNAGLSPVIEAPGNYMHFWSFNNSVPREDAPSVLISKIWATESHMMALGSLPSFVPALQGSIPWVSTWACCELHSSTFQLCERADISSHQVPVCSFPSKRQIPQWQDFSFALFSSLTYPSKVIQSCTTLQSHGL